MAATPILVFAASLRAGSLNRQLAHSAAAALREQGAAVTLLDLKEYPLPIYDGDLEQSGGIPQPAQALHAQLAGHRGVFIASPEYNAGLTPLLVNALSWVSRVKEAGGQGAAFGTPVYALGSASPGGFGGYRGLIALRHTLELGLGARVLPAMVAVPAAHQAFDATGALTAPGPLKALHQLAETLVAAATPG
ncbi:NADPH-dependent FMN reductase [Pseudoroseomonas cervicalis]|uniref:Flavin reductase n=1 Tax=Pseudoroseomonas cervicalis ATCC 49957 TaxID=525371 RepID=D5RJW2_9PROT|nr:NAD(P)H-dependent oxidoreductase [Pseudoroseomonas cervicalis]EFH12401.1 flavin reductase [Pseudoroseomonas cervicalis ATCC 49957]